MSETQDKRAVEDVSDDDQSQGPEQPTEELTIEQLDHVTGGLSNFGNIPGEATDKDHKDWIG